MIARFKIIQVLSFPLFRNRGGGTGPPSLEYGYIKRAKRICKMIKDLHFAKIKASMNGFT